MGSVALSKGLQNSRNSFDKVRGSPRGPCKPGCSGVGTLHDGAHQHQPGRLSQDSASGGSGRAHRKKRSSAAKPPVHKAPLRRRHSRIQTHATRPRHLCRSWPPGPGACPAPRLQVARPEEVEAVRRSAADHARDLGMPVDLLNVRLAGMHKQKLGGKVLLCRGARGGQGARKKKARRRGASRLVRHSRRRPHPAQMAWSRGTPRVHRAAVDQQPPPGAAGMAAECRR